MFRTVRGALIAAATIAPAIPAQMPDTSRKAVPLDAVTVTATRTARSTFDTPQPITVIDSATLREKLPHGAADLFRDIAGLDASGVGPSQRRPEIRLQRGQRILVLADGLRLNNARRQQDFGELPALAGSIDRVEIVRGPSSVLYGTDAIGGVVNLISGRVPSGLQTGDIRGEVTYRYGSAGEASTPSGSIMARFGRLGVSANASYREAADYRAPKGTFGNITLDESVIVFDSGIRDRAYEALLSYDVSATTSLFTRVEFYRADEAGFGFIDPAKLGVNQPTIQILYPDQDYSRYTAGYRASTLSTVFASRAEITAYTQRNERHLNNLAFIPITPTANVDSRSYNFTDLGTIGARVELAKSLSRATVLTYGVDAFRDQSENTDSSRTVTTGFGPTPSTSTSNVPSVPNATFRSVGAFTQLELRPVHRLSAVLGARVQDVFAETKPTPNSTAPLSRGRNRTGVWSANALYQLTGDFNVIAAMGRGFRAPNLVERFFQGAATEANGYQTANPALTAETSLNTDLGLRYRRGWLYAEAFVFRNDISDAIRAIPTGNTVNSRPEYQNQNIGKLRVDGLEITSGLRFASGFNASASFTRFDGRNVTAPSSPIGDSYSSKIVGELAYRPLAGRVTLGYTVRHQGEQREVIVGQNPIGPVIPAFTVHSARAGARLFHRRGVTNSIVLSAENLGDKLYAEFPNASFFRPEAGRSVNLALVAAF